MGILGLLIRGAREKAQEYSAKNELEGKLGRRVSNQELYSLGSHLDAAQGENKQKPLNYAQREASVPFADAKPPGKYRKYIVLTVC